jgi:hypothetical protein
MLELRIGVKVSSLFDNLLYSMARIGVLFGPGMNGTVLYFDIWETCNYTTTND